MFSVHSTLTGTTDTRKAWFPISANIAKGAGIRKSAPGTVAAVGASAANFLGFADQDQPYPINLPAPNAQNAGTNGTLALGTQARIAGHSHRHGDKYRVPFSFAAADVVSAMGGTANTITLANSDANQEGSYIFIVSGPGAGQLYYVTSNVANASYTVLDNWTTQPTNASKFIRIPPVLDTVVRTEATGLRLLGQALEDAGGNVFKLLEIRIQLPNGYEDQLTPPGAPDALGRGGFAISHRDFAAAGATVLGQTTTPQIFGIVEPMLPY